MNQSCPREFVVLAERLADAAGDVVRQYFRQPLDIADKPDETPVTQADREAETRMREMIAQELPGHGVVGEEHGSDRADAEFVWVLDPIDGTKAFISGVPVFGTLIALLRAGRPVLGVIDHPALRERWVGAAGQPTRMNGAAVRVAPRGDLEDAVLWTTSPHMFDGDPPAAAAYARLRDSVRFVHYGGECYQYGMLASGFIDIVVEDDMSAYDYCALVPVVQGAGGIITDWQGGALGIQSGGKVLAAASAALHGAARRILDA
ncbi:MAG: histidinol-phosphatase [Alphaproteobacteria bacterium]|nr:histidinol-phosphatase [Alphaproteobacteria bacterium]